MYTKMGETSLNDMVKLCLDRDVDFEIFHGDTGHKSRAVRTQMIISPFNAPSVLVSFGDKKHGQKVSRIALGGKNQIAVTLKDLTEFLSFHHTGNRWKRAIQADTPLWNLEPFKGGVRTQVVIESEAPTVNTAGRCYEGTIQNYVLGEDGPVEHVSTPVVIQVESDELALVKGAKVDVQGEYVFPNTIRATVLSV